MIVYTAKRVIIFVPKFAKKSPFLNARLARGTLSAVSFNNSPFLNARLVRGTLSAVSFFLQMSTTMAIHAYGKDCLLF
jgi:hypothetical protein